MTFSILAQDPETGAIGGAAATGSLCVGGWVLRGDLDAGMSAKQIAARTQSQRRIRYVTLRDVRDPAQHIIGQKLGVVRADQRRQAPGNGCLDADRVPRRSRSPRSG